MTTFDIAASSNIIGNTLEELAIREQLGINIAFIKRGEITINIPTMNASYHLHSIGQIDPNRATISSPTQIINQI